MAAWDLTTPSHTTHIGLNFVYLLMLKIVNIDFIHLFLEEREVRENERERKVNSMCERNINPLPLTHTLTGDPQPKHVP